MDFKQIAYFVQVAELGSFTRAAAVLGVAQPALSRQVRALEVELRQALFERNGRGVTLTTAGSLLLAHGRGLLQQLERVRQDLADHRGAAAGVLSIGLPPSVSRLLAAPLVGAFKQRFPRARLGIVEGLSTHTLEWLAQGRLDCAVVYNATPSPAIHLQALGQEPLFLITARPGRAGAKLLAAAINLRQLATRELVIPSRPHAIRMRLETVLAEVGLRPRIGLEIESVPAILDLVHSHGLAALLSMNAVHASGREADFSAHPVRLGHGRRLSTSLWLATSAQRPGGPLLEQASQLLEELMRSLVQPVTAP